MYENAKLIRPLVWVVALFFGTLVGVFAHPVLFPDAPEVTASEKPGEPRVVKFKGNQTKIDHPKTTGRGERTRTELLEHVIELEVLQFEETQLVGICFASEIRKVDNKLEFKDPVFYDLSDPRGFVTRTSGDFGEALIREEPKHELSDIRVWGKSSMVRYRTTLAEKKKLLNNGAAADTLDNEDNINDRRAPDAPELPPIPGER